MNKDTVVQVNIPLPQQKCSEIDIYFPGQGISFLFTTAVAGVKGIGANLYISKCIPPHICIYSFTYLYLFLHIFVLIPSHICIYSFTYLSLEKQDICANLYICKCIPSHICIYSFAYLYLLLHIFVFREAA